MQEPKGGAQYRGIKTDDPVGDSPGLRSCRSGSHGTTVAETLSQSAVLMRRNARNSLCGTISVPIAHEADRRFFGCEKKKKKKRRDRSRRSAAASTVGPGRLEGGSRDTIGLWPSTDLFEDEVRQTGRARQTGVCVEKIITNDISLGLAERGAPTSNNDLALRADLTRFPAIVI